MSIGISNERCPIHGDNGLGFAPKPSDPALANASPGTVNTLLAVDL